MNKHMAVYHSNMQEPEGYLNSWVGVYLHGELQRKIGWDIVSVPKDVPEGIHHVTVVHYEKEYEAVMFIWKNKIGPYIYRGYIVLPDDTESVKFAQEKFDKNSQII